MTAVLEPLRRDSPGTPTRVDPGDFQATAQAFAAGQTAINDIMITLRSNLAPPNSPCIGRDTSAEYIASRYRPAADTVMTGLAEPEATGYQPSWLPGILNGVWPCADAGALAATQSVWRNAATSLRAVQGQLHSALTALVDNNSGDDLNALNEFWAQYVNGAEAIFPALDRAVTAIADALAGYGQVIEDFQGQLDAAIAEAAATAAPIAILAVVADGLTDGAAALLTGPEGAAIAEIAGAFVNDVVDSIMTALVSTAVIGNLDLDAGTALRTAVQDMSRPALATHEAWQTGDDIHPVPNSTPRGQFDVGGDKGEMVIANYLQGRSHVVMPVREDHSKVGVTNTDALVDGKPVDFKKLVGSGPRTLRSALAGSERGAGQADEIFVDARTSVLTAGDLQNQLRSYFSGLASPGTRGIIKRVTILAPDGSRITYPSGYGGS